MIQEVVAIMLLCDQPIHHLRGPQICHDSMMMIPTTSLRAGYYATEITNLTPTIKHKITKLVARNYDKAIAGTPTNDIMTLLL